MKALSSRVLWGATLFSTPGMKSGAVHIPLLTVIFAVITLAVTLAMIQRSWRPGPSDPDPGDGWDKRPKDPTPDSPVGPRGGIPLDDAVPARVRLRDARRLVDLLPARSRRRVREPEREPIRETTPS